ncbi:MAG: DUF1801 domain-containing protein [Proteobacteria bacterium]|nr:DUF1801 domain-containing protein [Pseudomonadota bacterium]
MAGGQITDYIAGLPADVRPLAEAIRDTIRRAAPESVEGVKYGIPSFALAGRSIIYFGVWKKHVALYPIYAGSAQFEREIAPYRTKKDTVRFPLGKPIPYDLITRIVQSQLSRLPLPEAE